MTDTPAMIGLVAATPDEMEALQPGLDLLERLEQPVQRALVPLWSDPDQALRCARQAQERGVRVLIVAAGSIPHLPGLLSAACDLPVVAVPLSMGHLKDSEVTALALATGPQAPVVAVEPGGVVQAVSFALRLVDQLELNEGPSTVRTFDDQETSPAISHAPEPIAHVAHAQPQEVPEHYRFDDDEEEDVQVQPVNLDRPLSGHVVGGGPGPMPVPSAQPALAARMLGLHQIDPDNLDVALIEDAVDCLLEGGVVAFPTETVYGLAVDATNPRAVERLFELKGRPHNKAISLMVDQPRMLTAIVCNLTIDVKHLMEAFWPGPLTLVFQKRQGNFMHVSDGPTIGVRMPDHPVPLAIMQALARPLACTSANLSGQPTPNNGREIHELFGGRLNLTLDSGPIAPLPPSTVLDVTEEPFRILRKGTLSFDQLAAIVGDHIEPVT